MQKHAIVPNSKVTPKFVARSRSTGVEYQLIADDPNAAAAEAEQLLVWPGQILDVFCVQQIARVSMPISNADQ